MAALPINPQNPIVYNPNIPLNEQLEKERLENNNDVELFRSSIIYFRPISIQGEVFSLRMIRIMLGDQKMDDLYMTDNHGVVCKLPINPSELDARIKEIYNKIVSSKS